MQRYKSVSTRGVRALLFGTAAAAVVACGQEEMPESRRAKTLNNAAPQGGADATAADSADSADSTAESPRLAQADTDQVVSSLVVNFGKDGMSLVDAAGDVHWVVDMEQREDVNGSVAPLKYLKLKGDLTVPSNAENKEYQIGCLYVELKDNVYYREKTWLRMASTGISGAAYPEVKLPLSVDMGAWKAVPVLEDSITLQTFAGNTLKKFDATLCFKLDFSNAPADSYQGQLVVQYLRPGDAPNPPSCDKDPAQAACKPQDTPTTTMPPTSTPTTQPPAPPVIFGCTSPAQVLKAGQTAELSWTDSAAYSALEVKLAADDANFKGDVGTFTVKNKNTIIYKAPAKVPAGVRVIATARALKTEFLPAFCQINLLQDDQLGCKDNGEINGVVGNVYKLPVNTAKLPDLDKMTPVDTIVAPNLDIPDHDWQSGFPGVKDLVEWFAIKFRGQVIIPAAQSCSFKTASDDGSNVYLDGVKIIDNDGVHPVQSKASAAVNLTAGNHDFRVDWYQGPRVRIALQLFWKCGNAADYTIMPPSAFVRPLQ
jgi:hypothetical protein